MAAAEPFAVELFAEDCRLRFVVGAFALPAVTTAEAIAVTTAPAWAVARPPCRLRRAGLLPAHASVRARPPTRPVSAASQ